ncbi:MAG: tRNA (guanosine(37)-N1)-methyltransferase TrmD [Halofilum sp. (in: g-proteobacteria)]|nr:tRNA (guanosine(37)-N1)-methyltransferase TrmD [Halofilum sp. (in: g-proteobacteria)]
MRIDVVTLFPEQVRTVAGFGVTGRALERGLYSLHTWDPRDETRDAHRTVDDRPFGGGPGMLMQVQPLRAALRRAQAEAPHGARRIHLGPQGRPLDQRALREMAKAPGLILLCGRYEGVDERVLESDIDEEWSLGDFVLSGGELAAMVVIDGVVRLLPGAVGDEQSVDDDSFADGLLEGPQYTRPEEIDGQRVPAVLLSGDHRAIARWRRKQALGRTWLRRPDLLAGRELGPADRRLLEEFIAEHRGTAAAAQ